MKKNQFWYHLFCRPKKLSIRNKDCISAGQNNKVHHHAITRKIRTRYYHSRLKHSIIITWYWKKIIGGFLPLKEAVQRTRFGKIRILAKVSCWNKILDKYIKKNVPYSIHVKKINATSLVDLVKSGKFISQKQIAKNIIKKIITPHIENNIDVFTLSSTHLLFLVLILKELFPGITFLDPTDALAQHVSNNQNTNQKNLVWKFIHQEISNHFTNTW